jgi:ABC-type nickel/cobalt efflux system permease component RcnA/ABC-type uncharacterized transport system substrate-binding protein
MKRPGRLKRTKNEFDKKLLLNNLMKKLIIIIILFASPVFIHAHPHVFVDCSITVVFDQYGLAGFHNHWVLDRMFSGNMLSSFAPGYDSDQLTLTPSDIKSIKKGAFDSLKNFNYFQHIRIQNKDITDFVAQDFNAKATTKGLVYDFFIPCYINADVDTSTVKMSVFDDSFYTSIRISSFLISESDALNITHAIGPINSFKYYMGQITPKGIAFQFTKYESSSQKTKKLDSATERNLSKQEESYWQTMIIHINQWQSFIKDILTDFGNDIKKNFWGKSLFLFILFSFLYGVVHALGPGHGKSIVSSYFIARPGNYRLGILMAFVLSITHAISGAIFVLVMKLIFESPVLFSTALPVERVSYGLLIIVGIFLFIHAIIEIRKNDIESVVSGHNMKQLMFVAFTTGMIPCPGAAIILIFTISINIVGIGLIALLAMGIGMGVTTSIFAIIAIVSRNTITTMNKSSQWRYQFFHCALSVMGALIIIIFGIVMFFS